MDSAETSSSPPPLCSRCRQPLVARHTDSTLCPRCTSERLLSFALGDSAAVSPAPPAKSPLAAPARIGPYQLLGELGRGGMGVVYLAQHAQLGRVVALKAIPCSTAASSALEMRFLREARTIAQLQHPHIVTVHDAGQADGHAYLAMDYVESGDLAQRLREQRQLEPRAAALLLQRVAAAVAHSHAQGVLHRDLKPSNILLAGDEPRVSDFGLAAQLEPGGDLTVTMAVLGTPHYFAPEAFRDSADRGVPADVYSLGVILYETLAGRTPFAGASAVELPALVATAEPPPLRLLAPHVPRDLETICRHCLEPEPARRYASAAALAEDLRRFLAGEPIAARPVSGLSQLVRWARRRPQLAAVWLLSLLLAAASTFAAIAIDRARTEATTEARRAELALHQARRSELLGRGRLRDAKFAEARALRHTTEPGRRSAALHALAEAAEIRPGADLRDEALAALLVPEFVATRRWSLQPDAPVAVTLNSAGTFAVVEDITLLGAQRGAFSLYRWGETKPVARLEVPGTSPAGPARFSPDGSHFAARYHDDTLHVWRTADASSSCVLAHVPPPVPDRENARLNDDFDFTAGGTALCLGLADGGVAWHRLADGREIARTATPLRFTTVRCSPDGRRVAACSMLEKAGGHRQVFIFRTPGEAPERILEISALPRSIAWSPDGRLLGVTSGDNAVTAFDVRTGRVVHAFISPVRDPSGIAFLGGSAFVALAGSGSSLHVFDLALGQELAEFGSFGQSPLVVEPAGNAFYFSSLDGDVTRWEVHGATAMKSIPLPSVAGYEISGDIGAMDFSDDGRWIATAHGRFAAIRASESGAFAGELDGGPAEAIDFSSVMFSADRAALLTCSTVKGLRRHPFKLDATGAAWTFGGAEVLDAEPGFLLTAHTADRRLIALVNRDSGAVKILDLSATAPRLVSRWQTEGVNSGSFSPDGRLLLLNCSGLGPDAATMRLRVYHVADGTVAAELAAPVSCDTAWSDDGRTALTSNGQTESIIWNTDTWTPRARLSAGLGGNATTFTLSPDGRSAVIYREGRLNFVDTATGAVRASYAVPGESGIASAIRFLPDGRRFALLWPDGGLHLFEPAALEGALAAAKIR